MIDFDDRSYEHVYFGAHHYSMLEKGFVEVENPLETKLMLESILHRYSNGNPHNDLALSAIRGRAIDYIKMVYHGYMGHFEKAK